MTTRRERLAARHPQFIATHLEFGPGLFLRLHDLNESYGAFNNVTNRDPRTGRLCNDQHDVGTLKAAIVAGGATLSNEGLHGVRLR